MSTEIAVQTLIDADPDFQLLCGVLYGPDAGPDEVWSDVFGVSKSENPNASSTMKRVGLAATLIGAGLGVKELGEGMALARPAGRVAHAIEGAKKITPKPVAAVLKKPAFKIGAAGSMLAGDMAATESQRRGSEKVGVAKFELKPLTKLVEGIKLGARKAEAMAPQAVKETAQGAKSGLSRPVVSEAGKPLEGPLTEEATTKLAAQPAERAATQAKGYAVGQGIKHPLQAMKARPVTTAALGATGVLVARERKSRQDATAGYDDYAKRDVPEFEASGEFTKFDDDKRLAFGWASVVKKDGVEVVDRQGDWIDPDDLENAAYKYVLSSRIGGDMHKRNGDQPHHVSDLVESFVVTPEKIAKMGLPESTPIGWWVGFKVHDDDTWQLVKKKGRTGFSIHGRGKRRMHELDF